jgi:uncharacterized protein YcbX
VLSNMRVDQIWSYPVKSMVGGTVASAEVSMLGIVGDRRWAVRDLERGGIRGAKQMGGLMTLAAREVPGDTDDTGDVEIDFPDGRRLTSKSPDIDEALSAHLGHPVRLEALRPADDLDHYRRGAPANDDFMVELRNIFGREESEPLPDFSVFPPEVVEFESPPGTYHDCWPLMIMSTTALESMRSALPDSIIDVRRFRPSVVIDTPGATGHPEFAWAGRTARLGDATIAFESPCPRCVMVTREVADLPADRSILRHIVRDLDQNVGIYARVVEPGSFATGDELRFID